MTMIIEPQALLESYRREGLSLLQYVRQATPYASKSDRPLADRIRAIAESESKCLDVMANELADARLTVPSLGGFPSEHANFNYFDVRKLLPYLITEQERLIDCLRNEITEDEGGIRPELLRLKESHCSELKTLSVPVSR